MRSMLEQIAAIDTKVFLFLNGLHTWWLDPVMWLISSRVLWFTFAGVLAAVAIKRFRWRGALFITAAVVVAGLVDLLSVHGFKDVFMRLRPTHNLEIRDLVHTVNDYRGGRFGFVSGHAASSFGLATFFALVGRRRWLTGVAYGCAFLVAYSRIYLGVHYPGDVVGGAVLGFACGIGVYVAHRRVERRLWPDTNPKE